MPSDDDQEDPDPAAYCLSAEGAVLDPSCWQRDDSGEIDVEDNWQGNHPHDQNGEESS
jgi:hypothetical protein